MKNISSKNNLKNASFLTVIILVGVFLALAGATFAWFTSNTKVETSKVSATTSEEDIKLLVSSTGTDFKGSEECDIVHINTQDQEVLIPVSTLDLETFVYSMGGDTKGSKSFGEVKDEKYYYHGRIYLKAEGTGNFSDKKMAVYLDNSDGLLIPDTDSLIAAASRIGLKISQSEKVTDSVIYFLSNEKIKGRKNNTIIDGKVQTDEIVLTMDGSKIVSKNDPAIAFPEAGKISENPAFTIDVNKVYTVDIYFYLEGCDPDCTEEISLDGITFSLNFMGILDE